MCRFDSKDMVGFLMIFLPFAVTAIAGMIRAGYGWYLLFWLAYSIFFFFVWEARVHANYGVIKIWKYRPGPMGKWEQAQFAIGTILMIGFPFVFLVLGREYLLILIALTMVVTGFFSLRRTACNRCINFSCPMNAVDKQTVDAYLERNPDIRGAWERSGYRLGE